LTIYGRRSFSTATPDNVQPSIKVLDSWQKVAVSQREVLFEGLSEQEILALPREHVEKLILFGEPLVFRAGSAELLGSFKIASDRLVVELAQIEGGGEGVLVSLASLAKRYVTLRRLSGVEWIIHAVT
jgi:hypothetical protein